jgi:3-methyladenine DNA glycosylase Mpg
MADGNSELRIEQGTARHAIATARIGITRAADRKWRFIDPSSMYISRKLVTVGQSK